MNHRTFPIFHLVGIVGGVIIIAYLLEALSFRSWVQIYLGFLSSVGVAHCEKRTR